MALLDGSGRSVDLAAYRIRAPGLRGTAEIHEGATSNTRGGPERATEALAAALQGSGVNDLATIELGVQEEPLAAGVAPLRTSQGEPGLVIETPDLGETVGQVILAVDESGVMTWNFPEDDQGRRETPAVRGAGGRKRFVIRGTIPPPEPAADEDKPATRGLAMTVGRKLLKVLVYPVVDKIGGEITEHFAGKWEAVKRPYLLRPFGPDDYLDAEVAPLSGPQWQEIGRGRSLLFVHGTFSNAHGAFATVPRATLAELRERYEGRIFAFNHHTLSHDPAENVRELAARLPENVDLDVDIICHSRGGLVSRALALAGGAHGGGGASIPLRVHKIVFVGTPNFGTPLADPDHMVAFIDRYTSVLNLAPPGPAGGSCRYARGGAHRREDGRPLGAGWPVRPGRDGSRRRLPDRPRERDARRDARLRDHGRFRARRWSARARQGHGRQRSG